MPRSPKSEPRKRLAAVVALLLPLAIAACGGGSDTARAEASDRIAMDAGEPDEAGPQRPAVDPCALLTPDEVSEQLVYTIPAYNRGRIDANGFEVEPAEVDWGVSRRCEIAWRTTAQVGDGPVARGTFIVMVFPVGMLAINESDRRAVTGAGPEIFRHQRVYYVTKDDLAASLTDFGGTQEEGRDESAGRVALLEHIASRLP